MTEMEVRNAKAAAYSRKAQRRVARREAFLADLFDTVKLAAIIVACIVVMAAT
jgi:hypothetical protein